MVDRWLKVWITNTCVLGITEILHWLQLAKARLGGISVVTEIKCFGTAEIIYQPGDGKNVG